MRVRYRLELIDFMEAKIAGSYDYVVCKRSSENIFGSVTLGKIKAHNIIFGIAEKCTPRDKQFTYKPFWNANLAILEEKSSLAHAAEQSKRPEDIQ
ncbi:hypothetical protein TNCV_3939991 [Trichonephila clavipes]|uniref:Uncharacterized protein n=1 Tax=Trichonephila clavipes TaxID=2585209 RepID=A0A8X6VVI1_TRICX|nr:hypothetical protein TNCV_3939991 [Trichonephila clavipes]